MKRTWSTEELKLLNDNYSISTPSELMVLLADKTKIDIGAKAKVLGLRKEKQRFHFTPEQIADLIEIFHNTQNKDLALKYGCSIHTIENKGFMLKLRKDKEFIAEMARIEMQNPDHAGRKHWIKKGNIPSNKGKKQTEYMSAEKIERTKATRFKKGQDVCNKKPLGYERITKDGYIEVKVEEPNKWELKHRMVWIKNFGSIPEGWNVQFKDKNPINVDPFNLYIISRSNQLKYQNSIYQYPEDLRNTIYTLRKLNKQIKSHETN